MVRSNYQCSACVLYYSQILMTIFNMIMNKESLEWVLLTLVVVGLVGLGVLIVNQGTQLNQVSYAVSTATSKIEDLATQRKNQQIVPKAQAPQSVLTTLTPGPSQPQQTPSSTNILVADYRVAQTEITIQDRDVQVDNVGCPVIKHDENEFGSFTASKPVQYQVDGYAICQITETSPGDNGGIVRNDTFAMKKNGHLVSVVLHVVYAPKDYPELVGMPLFDLSKYQSQIQATAIGMADLLNNLGR